ncbi:MAG: DUF1573 domain-containing protein [Planctomycetaceae bacterium]
MNTESTPQETESISEPPPKGAALIGMVVVAGFLVGAAGMYFMPRETEIQAEEIDSTEVRIERLPIAESGPYPDAVVDEKIHKFGSMEFGDIGSHAYVVTNNGEAPLQLKQGPKSCACTRYDIEDTLVQPGESTKVHVEWKPKKAEPIFRQAMNLYTNDPENQVIVLTVGGHVAERVRIIPAPPWDIGNLISGKPGTTSGVAATSLMDTMEVSNIKTSHPSLTVETRKADSKPMNAIDANDGVEFHLALSNEIPAGPFRGYFTFEVKGQEYKIDVKAHREGSIQFVGTPGLSWNKRQELVNLGEFKASEGKKGKLLLYVADTDELSLEDVTTKPSFLKCSLEKDPDFPAKHKSRYILTFEIPPGSPAGGYVHATRGRAILKTNHPEYPEIKLQVQFISVKDN